jgi:hypothetical protein
MKRHYMSKTAMAKDIVEKTGLNLKDVQSRLSRSNIPKTVYLVVLVDGERMSLRFYETPSKFL